MIKIKNLIIGFGKAGKTLAAFFGEQNEEVVLVEKSKTMYGGTCINVGCIPTKKLITLAKNATTFKEAVEIKNNLVTKLNNANYQKLAQYPTVKIIDGTAKFIADDKVEINGEIYIPEKIFINTGATPIIPNITGLKLSDTIHTSETIMNLKQLPSTLTIIGGGFIGLEFASMFAKFGTSVTILDSNTHFLPNEDDDVVAEILNSLQSLNIQLQLNATIEKIEDNTIYYSVAGQQKTISQDHILISTGRKPNIADLSLENTSLALTSKGAIKVDQYLKTNIDHIYALGDVNGGPNFTYISLDDFRIIKSQLMNQQYTLNEREAIPTTVFIYPPLSKVGINEKTAKAQNLNYQVFTMKAVMIPNAKVLGNETGIYKVIVDKDTKLILGATLFAEHSQEVINLFTLAMNNHITYDKLRDQIYTHPTMAEALNDLLK